MAISALSAATTACETERWRLSNLALQKLLYLAHRTFMGRHHRQLVDEPFEAWTYGPVLPSLYQETRVFGSGPILEFRPVRRNLTLPEHEIVREVVIHFRGLSPAALVELTHLPKGAWDRNFVPGIRHTVISDADILAEYYMVNREQH